MLTPSLIVHGGAWNIMQNEQAACKRGCEAAAQAGWDVLHHGGSALDAVEAATRVLEDDPTFDAGVGSHLNTNGEVELDAIIMDGATLNNGAVAAIQRVRNPISVARAVMSHTRHCLLAGAGAEAFARQMGFPICAPEDLVVEREREHWRNGFVSSTPQAGGTVGAVARDAHGNLAAATSTGGTLGKMPGRVGDSPLIGCGAYADNAAGAASATGWGESLMKVVICKTACDLMEGGISAQAAAEAAIARLISRADGSGGIITVDSHGGVGFAFNTPHLARAWALPDGNITVGV